MNKSLLILPFILLLLVGCQTEYNGDGNANLKPNLDFSTYNADQRYETNKKIRVGWNSNDADGLLTKFYWAVSADSSIHDDDALSRIPSRDWTMTDKMYADVPFPFNGQVQDSVQDPMTHKWTRYVRSSIFIYAMDEDGNRTAVKSRMFWRTNRKPDRPTVTCNSFGWDSQSNYPFSEYQTSNEPRMFLSAQTNYWNPIQFRWVSDDADGDISDKVVLKFRWILLKYSSLTTAQIDTITRIDGNKQAVFPKQIDSYPADSVAGSGVWDEFTTTVDLDEEVAKYIGAQGFGHFKLIVKVLDDGNEESAKPCVNVFEAFKPAFNEGVMLVNLTKIPSANEAKRGYPDRNEVKTFYQNMFEFCGFHPINTSSPDTMSYSYKDSLDIDMKTLAKHRLLVVYSDSRDGKIGAFTDFTMGSFTRKMVDYIKMGGKVLIAGCNMLSESSTTQTYVEPKPVDFLIAANAVKYSALSSYFGIVRLTDGEVLEVKPDANFRNYDFIGVSKFDHAPDLDSMKVDPVKINQCWTDTNKTAAGVYTKYYRVKGNGKFLPSVNTIGVSKGEIICGYKSVYQDLQMSADPILTKAGGFHTNYTPANTPEKAVLNRNEFEGTDGHAAVGTRFVPNNKQYRTAFIGLPLSFMDNTNNAVFKNMKAMIKWFDLRRPAAAAKK